MSVGFRYSDIWREFGDSDLLQAFFSTISCCLESSNWGSKYPYLLKKLYYEQLKAEEISNAIEELLDVREKFEVLKPEYVVWDAEDLTKKPPSSFYSKLKAANLSDCFVSVSEKNIFDVLLEVFEFCKRRGISVKIQSENDLVK